MDYEKNVRIFVGSMFWKDTLGNNISRTFVKGHFSN